MIKTSKRNTKYADLSPYCHMSDEHASIEVTEWTNCEGVDVHIISNKDQERISLTYGQFEALQALMSYKE